MENRKKVFISVPMEGIDEALIKRRIQLAKRNYCRRKKISAKDVEFYDNLTEVKALEEANEIKLEDSELVKNVSVTYLGLAIQLLGFCDEAIFAKGWKDARGCQIEHEVCVRYGIPIDDQETILKIKVDKKTGKITKVE